MNNTTKMKIHKVGSIALSVLVVLLLVLVGYLVFCSITNKVAFIGKYATVRIVSKSMEPTIMTDDYILVEKIKGTDAKLHEVILFRSHDATIKGGYNTHRIIEITDGSSGIEYVTQGDNNPGKDSLTTKPEDVAGRFVKVLPLVTRGAKLFSNKIVFFILIIVPSFILLLVCIRDVIKRSRAYAMDLLVAEQVKKMQEASSEADDDSEGKNDV